MPVFILLIGYPVQAVWIPVVLYKYSDYQENSQDVDMKNPGLAIGPGLYLLETEGFAYFT